MDDAKNAYARWAPSYDSDRNATRDLDALVLRRAPLALTGRDVLELGCGTGKNTVWLAQHARTVTAIDFSAEMLALARRRVTSAEVTFVEQDIREPWPLASRSMDVVTGNLVLEHVQDLTPVYREAARVVRPGGQLFFCELHPVRQQGGGQAHFTDAGTGETVHVPAHMHTISEYVNGGVAAGFVLMALGEWTEEDAPAAGHPRLLSVLFERTAISG